MVSWTEWCRIMVLNQSGQIILEHVLEGPGDPIIGSAVLVARVALLAGREGWSIELTDVVPALSTLLDLTGLPTRMQGRVEFGEEPIEAHRCDERHFTDGPV
jgi:hypothetical protein